MKDLLALHGVEAGYGSVPVLHEVSMTVPEGALVGLVGSNGAGKSTVLRTISGLLRPSAGRIVFRGEDLTARRPDRIVDAGVLHVAENRRMFRRLSVSDNLDLGLYGARLGREEERVRTDRVLELFPMLAASKDRPAGLLSGGQQQMLVIAQALLRDPVLLMLDEPSLGLAPSVVDEVFGVLSRLKAEGVTILLVEQVVERALELADLAFVLQTGRVVGSGPGHELLGSDLVEHAYLGAAAARTTG